MKKQVDRSHYAFARYMYKDRWASMWHQLDEVLALEPGTVLEIGPGPGLFKALGGLFGVRVETLDLDPDLDPDHVAPAESMPFADGSYDVVCAFQMLEHIPYQHSLAVFREMARVARTGVVISLPDAQPVWPWACHIPRLGRIWVHVPRPAWRPRAHEFDGEHYWEINKKGYPPGKVRRDFSTAGAMEVTRSFRVDENPYHRFFVFRK
jgi:SAM-dependent methyltransferase